MKMISDTEKVNLWGMGEGKVTTYNFILNKILLFYFFILNKNLLYYSKRVPQRLRLGGGDWLHLKLKYCSVSSEWEGYQVKTEG